MKKYLIVFLLLISCLFSSFIGSNINSVHAEDVVYTNVLEDLHSDKTFDKANYPLKSNDYSIQVIQVAESVNNELFVYTYQPSANVKASSISISTIIGEEPDYYNYKLGFINSNGVFYKYKVNNFELKTDEVRRYEISAIYRPFNNILDDKPTDDNTTNEVAFKVGKIWTAQTINNKVTYDCIDIEMIEITDKHVGLIRYYNGFKLYQSSCDSHYIAFTTDKQIDRLLSAEVFYTSRKAVETVNIFGTHTDYGTTIEDKVKLNYDEIVSNTADGWFGDKHTWNRIEKVSEFVLNEDLQKETEEILNNKQWVLRFLETDYISTVASVTFNTFTEVREVTILQLTFETEGVTYNLGVVDNKQSGDLNPDNNYGGLPAWLQKIVDFFKGIPTFFRILFYIFLGFLALVVVCLIFYVITKIVDLFKKKR